MAYLLPGGAVFQDDDSGNGFLLPGGMVFQSVYVAPEVPARRIEGGVPGKARKPSRRKPILVEIDGETFRVSSVAEANELLRQAEEAAEQKAQEQLEKSAKKPSRRKAVQDARKALQTPSARVVGSDIDEVAAAIEAQLRQTIERIRQQYEEAIKAIEIGAFLRRRQQEEEDDAVALLLMTL